MSQAYKVDTHIVDIPEVNLVELIGEGNFSYVYRGVLLSQNRNVVVKVSKQENHVENNNSKLFKKEALALASVNHPNLVEVLHYGRSLGREYIVMEYIEGRSLRTCLEDQNSKICEFDSVVCQILSGLFALHTRGLVHRDLKPENVMITDKGKIKIIDLGLVQQQESQESSSAVGSFLYAAPEQLGAIKRPVDHRADQYSLGVLMYELLTQKRPVEISNYNDLIVWHTGNSQPNFEKDLRGVDQKIVKVVKKLLQKDPDDRFDSLTEVSRNLFGGEFELKNNVFVGREGEFTKLSKVWNQWEGYRLKQAWVSGPPGVGKSYLIREFINLVKDDNHYYFYSKCEKDKDQPLYLVHHVVLQLCHYLKVQLGVDSAQSQIEFLLSKSQQQELLAVFPHFSGLIKSDMLATQGEVAIQNVFYSILQLFKELTLSTPFVFHIDDIQWVDQESLRFLGELNSSEAQLNAFIIYSMRDDEESLYKKEKMLEYFDSESCFDVSLKNFDQNLSLECMKVQFGEKHVDHQVLEAILLRAEGNPFAITEFVRVLLKESYVSYDWGQWCLQKEHFSNVKLPSSIVDLIIERVGRLSSRTREFLSVAAISGAYFNALEISKALGLEQESFIHLLNEALQERLIEKKSSFEFKFIHDRVVEALRGHLSLVQQQQMHWFLGRSILSKPISELSSQELFSLAEHLLHSGQLVDEKVLFDVLVEAGYQAVHNFLNEDANKYLDLALSLAKKNNFITAKNLCGLLAETYFRTKKLVEAGESFKKAIEWEADPQKRAALRVSYINVTLSQVDMGSSELDEHVQRALSELGDFSYLNFFFLFLYTVWDGFLHFTRLGRLFRKNQEKTLILSKTLFVNAHMGYHQLKLNTSLLCTIRSYFTASRVRSSSVLASATLEVALAMAFFKIKPLAMYLKKKGTRIAYDLADRSLLAECEVYAALVDEMLGNPVAFERAARKVLYDKKEYLHAINYLNGSFALLWSYALAGHMAKAHSMFSEAVKYLEEISGQTTSGDIVLNTTGLAMDLLIGKTKSNFYFDPSQSKEAVTILNEVDYLSGLLIQNELLQNILQESITEERLDSFVDRYKKISAMNPFFTAVIPPCNFYIWWPLACARLLEKGENPALLKNFKRALRELSFSRMSAYHNGHYLYLRGFYYQLLGKFEKAQKYYINAIIFSRKNNLPWVELEALYYRGLYFHQLGDVQSCSRDFQSAYQIASETGFLQRSRILHANFSNYLMTSIGISNSSLGSASGSSTGVTSSTQLQQDRQFNSLKNLSLSLSPVLDEKQQREIALNQIMEIMGAERVFLYSGEDSQKMSFIQGIGRNGELDEESDVSLTIINEVFRTKKPIVYTGQGSEVLNASRSIVANDIRSVIAAPMVLGEKMLGLIYCDNRLVRGVFSREDKDLLQAMTNHVTFSLEMARAAQLEISKRELEHNLELSGFVQSMLIPSEKDFEDGKLSCSFHYQSAEESGGDWIWMSSDKSSFTLFVGDVTGHGIGSAMITSLMAGTFKTAWENETENDQRMYNSMKSLHDNLVSFCQSKYSMSSSVLQVDYQKSQMNTCFAGAPEILVIREGKCLAVHEHGALLGFKDFRLGQTTSELRKNDRLVIYTDGLYEMRDGRGREFGLSRLRRFLLTNQECSSQELREKLVNKLHLWNEGRPLEDDLTFAIIDIKE